MSLARAFAHGMVPAGSDPARIANARSAATLDWQVVATRVEFEALAADWTALNARTAGASRIFLGYNWNWHWCNHYLDESANRLAIVVGRKGSDVVAIWPLLKQRVAGLTVVGFMGVPVSQYGDVLIDRSDPRHESWLREGWDYVIGSMQADLVSLRKVREDSAIAGLLRGLGLAKDNQQRAPYIDLRGAASFEAFEQRYSSKDRKNRRRKRRRMEEAGAVTCGRVATDEQRAASIALAMQRKCAWLADEGLLSAAVADPRFGAFFRDVAGDARRQVGCDIVELAVDGHAVATKITVSQNSYRGLHFTAYDTAAEKYSPGIMILETLIAEAIADGVEVFDFMAPAAAYKLEWTSTSVGIADYAIPIGALGRLYCAVYLRRLRPLLQRLAKDGPAPVRRLVGAVWRLACPWGLGFGRRWRMSR
jgi:CelD/BcsL family acetyltransferase involved in cellulose biosynthesis